MQSLVVTGMHGLGDNLHIRAIIRQLLAQKKYDVWLETSWVALYHDLIAQGLKVAHKQTYLRTQTKNAERERRAFNPAIPSNPDSWMRISYRGVTVKAQGSVLAAMMYNRHGLDYATADFRLPIPPLWYARIDARSRNGSRTFSTWFIGR
jgi:hypothetical protein